MDLSLTYGNSEIQATSLREGRNGRLLTTVRNGHEWPPQVNNVNRVCSGAMSPDETCFQFGKYLPQSFYDYPLLFHKSKFHCGKLGSKNLLLITTS